MTAYYSHISPRIEETDSAKELFDILRLLNSYCNMKLGDIFDASCRNIDRHKIYKKLMKNHLTMREIQRRSAV